MYQMLNSGFTCGRREIGWNKAVLKETIYLLYFRWIFYNERMLINYELKIRNLLLKWARSYEDLKYDND